MSKGNSCSAYKIIYRKQSYNRIPYGEEKHKWRDRYCHDCGVEIGQYHHVNCDVEECPICHLQFISCDCYLLLRR